MRVKIEHEGRTFEWDSPLQANSAICVNGEYQVDFATLMILTNGAAGEYLVDQQGSPEKRDARFGDSVLARIFGPAGDEPSNLPHEVAHAFAEVQNLQRQMDGLKTNDPKYLVLSRGALDQLGIILEKLRGRVGFEDLLATAEKSYRDIEMLLSIDWTNDDRKSRHDRTLRGQRGWLSHCA